MGSFVFDLLEIAQQSSESNGRSRDPREAWGTSRAGKHL